MCILFIGAYLVPPLLGYAELDWPISIKFSTLLGARFVIARLLQALAGNVFGSLALVSILFFLRILLRSQKVAIIVFVILLSLSTNPWIFAVYLVESVFFAVILMRFGLVALALPFFITAILANFPTTLDASAWYAGYGYAALYDIASDVAVRWVPKGKESLIHSDVPVVTSDGNVSPANERLSLLLHDIPEIDAPTRETWRRAVVAAILGHPSEAAPHPSAPKIVR